jgi:signal transduction histidine kinase
MSRRNRFPQLVSLACHDVRTPLATVLGFTRTLQRTASLPAREARYLGIIDAAAVEMNELLDVLALLARIEAKRYEPTRRTADTRQLAAAAADLLQPGHASVEGAGGEANVDPEPTVRAVAGLAEAARRHGGVERVELRAHGAAILISPVTAEAARIVLAEDLRDLGAAAGRALVEALGGSVVLDVETLLVQLPSGAGATGGGR